MTDRINRAFLFALYAHGEQRRKDGLPYIVHPFEVGMTLARNGADEALVCAGLLHDTIEDAYITPEQLRAAFDEEVAELVLEDSEDKSKNWEERKTAAIRSLYKLANLRSIRDRLAEEGDAVWSRFSRGKDKQAWLFRETAKALSPLEGLPMYEELKELTRAIFLDITEGD